MLKMLNSVPVSKSFAPKSLTLVVAGQVRKPGASWPLLRSFGMFHVKRSDASHMAPSSPSIISPHQLSLYGACQKKRLCVKYSIRNSNGANSPTSTNNSIISLEEIPLALLEIPPSVSISAMRHHIDPMVLLPDVLSSIYKIPHSATPVCFNLKQ